MNVDLGGPFLIPLGQYCLENAATACHLGSNKCVVRGIEGRAELDSAKALGNRCRK